MLEITTELDRYMKVMRPTPGCFFACLTMVWIIFNNLKLKSHADSYKELFARSMKYVGQCSDISPNPSALPPSLPPSLPFIQWEGQRGRETVLILPFPSVEDTVCFHWGSLSSLCPKTCCYATTEQRVLQISFYIMTQQTQTDILSKKLLVEMLQRWSTLP